MRFVFGSDFSDEAVERIAVAEIGLVGFEAAEAVTSFSMSLPGCGEFETPRISRGGCQAMAVERPMPLFTTGQGLSFPKGQSVKTSARINRYCCSILPKYPFPTE